MVASGPERTVFVIDDDAAARDSLVRLLESEGLQARGFACASAFLDQVEPLPRGCVVTDLTLPGLHGVDLIRTLKAAGSLLPVIVLAEQADVTRAVLAMKSGALDFLEKPFEAERVLGAVRAGLELNDARMDADAERLRMQRRMSSLTARERQVLDLIMEGASNKVIAARLAISPRTVEIYRANVMSKMRAESLSDLIRGAITAGAARTRA